LEKQELRERAAAALRGAPSPKHTARTPWSGYATVAQADGGSAAHDTREPSPRLSTVDDPEDHIGLASAAMPLAGMQSCCVRSRFSTRAKPSASTSLSAQATIRLETRRALCTEEHVHVNRASPRATTLCHTSTLSTVQRLCYTDGHYPMLPPTYLLHQPALVVLAAHASGIMCVCVMRPLTVYLGVCVCIVYPALLNN